MTPILVLSADGYQFVAEARDANEARAMCQTHDAVVAVVVEGAALRCFHDILSRIAEKSAMRLERQAWKDERLRDRPGCDYCGRRVSVKTATLDHKQPLSRDGADVPENWALACGDCNRVKGDSTVEEFRDRLLSGILFEEEKGDTLDVSLAADRRRSRPGVLSPV